MSHAARNASAMEMAMTVRDTGWRLFAGSILIMAGVMRLFDSVWAFGNHAALPEGLESGLLGNELSRYGWLFLITAMVLAVAGFMVFYRSQVARWVGIIAGALTCLGAATLLPDYPVWSVVYIALGTLVIYALAVHGGAPSADEAGRTAETAPTSGHD
jgi:uncharacterized membrane protein HdeD (DUF308 family)